MMFALSSWLFLTFGLGMAALFSVWSRRETKYRFLSVVAVVTGSLISAGAIASSMGWAMPCKYNLGGQYDVIGYSMVPDEVIYLFISTSYGPKACSVPWSTTKAQQLQDGEGEEGNGSQLNIPNNPFSGKEAPQVWNPPPTPPEHPKERAQMPVFQ